MEKDFWQGKKASLAKTSVKPKELRAVQVIAKGRMEDSPPCRLDETTDRCYTKV